MATTKKMTKMEKFEMLKAIPAVAENSLLMEFIEHEQALLTKKNSGEKKPTERQKENAEIQQAILEGMQENRLYTITELIKEIPACAGLQNQRVSTLVRQLMPEYITRTEVKGKALFQRV
jgi:hypothetical protein